MSGNNFSETILRQLMEDYKRFEDYKHINAVVQLVKLFAEEYKKRTELEKGIKDVIAPFFSEDEKMPEDLVEAVRVATEKKYISFSLPVAEGMPVSEIKKAVEETLNKCRSAIARER